MVDLALESLLSQQHVFVGGKLKGWLRLSFLLEAEGVSGASRTARRFPDMFHVLFLGVLEQRVI